MPPPPPPQVQADDHDALRPGARLGEFEILRVLGVGGFGIVYLALDHALDRQVAIKEYMPATLAARGDNSMVSLRSASHAETFAIGLKSFVNEAKLLARFDHPSLVKVYRFWEQNGTAYMVMPFYPGRTLKEERRAMGEAPPEEWVRQLVDPLLGALELLHREGVYHRDIAPDNILLQPGSPPVLLDFGAARRVIGDRTQTLTAILKPNFAPIEQYADVSHLRQGPWTDLYALGAVLHFVVTGKPPMPAAARAVHDELQPLGAPNGAYAGSLSPGLLKTIDWTLAVRPNERPQSVAQLRDAIAGRLQPPERPVVDISMSPTMPADKVVNAWARTEPVGGAAMPAAPAAGSAAAYEATVRDVPRAAPAPVPAPSPAPTPAAGRRSAAPGIPAASATAAAEAAARAAARRKRRRIGWATTGLAMVVVAAVSWFLGERYGSSDDDDKGPAVTASASAPATAPLATTVAPTVPAAVTPAASAAPVVAVTASPVAAIASQPAAAPARKPPVATRTPQAKAQPQVAEPQPVPAVTAPVAAAPAPAPAPAPQADTGPKSPREACGSRVFIAMMRCMERECETTRFYEHPQCRKLRRQEDIRNSR